MARKLSVCSGLFLLLATYVVLAEDGQHYWHEFRDLYSATFYSTTELMQGVFDAGPSPLRPPEQVAAWYSTKLFHIYLLQQLVNIFGTGLTSYKIIEALYAGMLIAAVGLIGLALWTLGMSKRQAVLTAGFILVSPGIVYLGFKLMAEVPSLLFSAGALTLFALGLRQSSRQLVLSGIAGLALAVSALANWTVPLVFVGFWSALALVGMPTVSTRKSIVLPSFVTWTTFFASLFIGLWLLGGSFADYLNGIAAHISFTKPLPMWMFASFNLGLLGMALWLLVPLAWLSKDKRARRFLVVWLVMSTVPIMVITVGFMEPRYLTPGIVPFVALVALGLEGLWERSQTWGWRPAIPATCVAVLGLFVIGGSAAAQRLMPYEADVDHLLQAVRTEAPSDSDIILLPWNYSDFHFLRFAFPARPIYLVQSAANESGETIDDPAWTARYSAMYGDHFLPNPQAFTADFSTRRVLYIGWTILPSLQNLRDLLLFMGRPGLAGYLDASHLLNHMTQTWLLQDARFRIQPLSSYGQYRVYDIKPSLLPIQFNPVSTFASDPIPEIPVWGIFETSFVNDARHYRNPFVDTELVATFLSPSGKAYNFFGFYDGDGQGGQTGNVWKLRFMCMETGMWTWSAKFIDGAPGGSGSFRCVDSSIPGPLRVDTDHRRSLTQANGKLFFPRWYYLHELLFTKEGLWQQDVDQLLLANGYNMVTVLTVQAERLTEKGWSRRPYEQPLFYPWVKDGGSVQWNTFDLASWHKLDRVLQYLQDREIYVYIFDGFFPKYPPRFPDNPVQEQLYLRYALSRIGVYWNATHNIAFEFSHYMPASRVKRIGRYIESIDPFNLLLTVHDTQAFPELVANETWLDFSNVQYYEGTARDAGISNPFILRQFSGKPVAATEVVWEGGPKLNAEQVRRGGWGVLLAGGFFLYGEFVIDYGAGSSHPFLKIMFDLMDTIPYWRMTPHNELVNPGHFCFAEPGREYVVYAEEGGPVAVDLSAVQGTFQAAWLNPRTGERTTMGKVVGGTIQTFRNPAGDDNDWVLHIRSLS